DVAKMTSRGMIMAESEKPALFPEMPWALINVRGIKDVPVGTKGYIKADDLRVDQHRHCWVNPLAELVPSSEIKILTDADKFVSFHRGQEGFSIGFIPSPRGSIYPRWRTAPKPEPKYAEGFDWIPVVHIE